MPIRSNSIVPHALDIHETLGKYETDREKGLSASQVELARQRHGWNRLPTQPKVSSWVRFLAQFRGLLIWILIVAAILAGLLGEWIDSVAILVIVLLNGLLGFFQEERANQALAALKAMASPMAKVFRDGSLNSLPAAELVPGDVICLEAGDKVPADARLLEAFTLSADEASLTGESVPVPKDSQLKLETETALADRANMVFMGTHVTTGKATAVVVATGSQTELGRIAGMLTEDEAELTPLQRRLTELGKKLVVICGVIISLIFSVQAIRGEPLVETLMVAVSLAVAAVPEGLPAVVTISLAIGLQRMVKRNALIRQLASVETLGSVTVICSDKTGTLTKNQMTVREIWVGRQGFEVDGAGYQPRGEFRELIQENSQSASAADPVTRPDQHPDLTNALTIGSVCNNSEVVLDESEQRWKVVGDPTEGALNVLADKGQIKYRELRQKIVDEIPFDSERKAMSVLVATDGKFQLYTKGAPEVILEKCTREMVNGSPIELDEKRKNEIRAVGSRMAGRALRVLALASKEQAANGTQPLDENELIFSGLVGMIDPPREEVRLAVKECFEAGIQPVMITGDHPDTALAVGRELEIVDDETEMVTGQQLEQMSTAELESRVQSITVYARVSAAHKLRVVEAWKKHDRLVAMTGDGVNDAPAVQAASIGIAMGKTGTDVTKEAADMILTDDNFASIVSAVREGRGIFDNIQKFVHYLLSCNAGEVILMFVATLLGWPLPLVAIQILWINLVTDGLPALALAVEPAEPGIMERQPRPIREPVINRSRGIRILIHGMLIALVSLIGFVWTYASQPENLAVARTVAFGIVAFSQLIFALVCRSQRYSLWQVGLFSNKWMLVAILFSAGLQFSVMLWPVAHSTFDVVTLSTNDWLFVMAMAFIPAALIEISLIVSRSVDRS